MKRHAYQTIKFLCIAFISLVFYSCNTEQSNDPQEIPMPAFTDVIPYEKLGSGKIAFERIGPADNNYSGIILIDVASKNVKTFSGYYSAPALSPSGDKLAYVGPSYATNSYDIFVTDLVSNQSQNVSGTIENDRSPAWNPAGTKIYFYLPSQTTYDQIFVEQSPVAAVSDRRIVSISNYFMGPYSISATKVVFNSYYTPTGIYTMSLDGNNSQMILAKPKDRYLESPCFSPDGNKIAYLSVERDSTSIYHSVEVKVMNADGSAIQSVIIVTAAGKTQWTNYDQINNVSVCWSPDGSKLLFVVHEKDLESHIYVVNADGTGLTKVTSLAGVTDRKVSWSR